MFIGIFIGQMAHDYGAQFLGTPPKDRARKDEQTHLQFNFLRWRKDTILLKIF